MEAARSGSKWLERITEADARSPVSSPEPEIQPHNPWQRMPCEESEEDTALPLNDNAPPDGFSDFTG